MAAPPVDKLDHAVVRLDQSVHDLAEQALGSVAFGHSSAQSLIGTPAEQPVQQTRETMEVHAVDAL
ncbi:hypothetical protein NKJ23_16150 [Mesorhizobium sp. M0184]|uniref:hypothetical protein n=1 Tax=Mesorhizobium sp. M0184 TaxID=2956906 RepID=UPI0033351572